MWGLVSEEWGEEKGGGGLGTFSVSAHLTAWVGAVVVVSEVILTVAVRGFSLWVLAAMWR